MKSVQDELSQRVGAAIVAALGDTYRDVDPLLTASTNPKFGDFQVNAPMSLAKTAGRKPRDLAADIVARLDLTGIAEPAQIAGPGFINITLTPDYIGRQLAATAADARLGIAPASAPQRVVVDYSGPNVAKQMHVGHLRSTIIGDAISRVLEVLGHDVIRQNHLGDWGTQFGMLIEQMIDLGIRDPQGDAFEVPDLEAWYRQAKVKFDSDSAFADRARRRVVLLQGGDAATLAYWQRLIDASYAHFEEAYAMLGVRLRRQDVRGESSYNALLPSVITELDAADMLQESEGAKVVFLEGFDDKDGRPVPLIVQKGDGGYLYGTTDLAAARYRARELAADRIIYVTDARQSQHFAMVFQAARKAGFVGAHVALEHVTFGSVLGEDKKPFKTRSGETVKLRDLLDEAVGRAEAQIEAKQADARGGELSPDERGAVARAVGIGAVKYADLAGDRVKDYVFSWDRMLSMEGNTAPYLQNAYVRIRSIFRKGEIDPAEAARAPITLEAAAERSLALKVLQLPAAVAGVERSLEPHRLCTYLYELATAYHKFYEQCPVLTAPTPELRASRLALCDLTARTLALGLDLLGIAVVERM